MAITASHEADGRKRAAAVRAADYIQSGMAVGLGTGTTAAFLVEEVAARLADGRLRDLTCVVTSERTRALAQQGGIRLTSLEDCPTLDIALDGADEIDPKLSLIKGAGGALLREKLVASAAGRFVVMADESKRVGRLGEKAPVPVEVVPFGWTLHPPFLESLGANPALRRTDNGEPFVTDGSHYIIDCHFTNIPDPEALAATLKARPGIVEHGLFLGLAQLAVIGTPSGVQILEP